MSFLLVSWPDGLAKVSGKFAVLHKGQSGNFLEEVSEVTSSHVRLFQPSSFSTNGVLVTAGSPVKAHCNVLIYRTNQKQLTLHIYVIVCDPARQQVSSVVTMIITYCVMYYQQRINLFFKVQGDLEVHLRMRYFFYRKWSKWKGPGDLEWSKSQTQRNPLKHWSHSSSQLMQTLQKFRFDILLN